jgi:hypothetical protein
MASFNSFKSAELNNLNESSLVWGVRTWRQLVLQWVQTSSCDAGQGMEQGGQNSDRDEILKSVERETQTVAETAKMRVRVICDGRCHGTVGWVVKCSYCI